MNETKAIDRIASPAVILNGIYGPDTIMPSLTPAQACLTAISVVMSSANTKDNERRDLKLALAGIWLVSKAQVRSMHLVQQQKVATGLLDAFVHAFGGDLGQAKRHKMFEHPTVVSIVKTFGIKDGDHSFTIGQAERKVGTSYVKLAESAAQVFDPHATA